MEIISVIVGVIGYFIVKYVLLTLNRNTLSKMIDEKISVFFERERSMIHESYFEDEKAISEEVNTSLIERYGYDTVTMTESLYKKYSEVFLSVDKELQRQFPISPELLQYSKIDKKIESLVQERLVLNLLANEVLLISCTFDVGIIDILNILKEKYNLTNCFIVPLHMTIINEIDRRNKSGNTKWKEVMSVSELILSIARNRGDEDWEMCSSLDKEFNTRLQAGRVTSQTFKSLLSLSSQIDTIIDIHNTISKDNQKIENKHLFQLIETVNDYNEKYKRYVYSDNDKV